MTHPAPRPRPTTMNDVARLAGVSVATVSKALNGRGRISKATRENVEAAARKLSFQPNRLAQGLLAGKTGTVGLITNDLEGRFSIPILVGAEDALGAGALSVFLCDARGDAIREQHHLSALMARRVDGILVVADRAEPRESLGRTLPVPVVYAYGESQDPEDTSVVTDGAQAGRVGVEHLLSVGRRRIAYVGGDPSYTVAKERADGAAEALAAAGLDFVAPPVFGPWSEMWGRRAARTLMECAGDLDAIMCGSDQIARGVLDGLHDLGRSVPDDVAVLGHDNWEPLATQSRPPLSTVDMNLREVGRVASRLLFDAMDGRPSPGRHQVDGRVVQRQSTL